MPSDFSPLPSSPGCWAGLLDSLGPSITKRKVLCVFLIAYSSPLHANTGAPILILFSTYIYIFGFVLIVLVEAACIYFWAKRGLIDSVKDSFIANFYSSLIGGVLLPFIVSVIGFMSYAMPCGTERFFSYMGTMSYRDHPTPTPSIVFTFLWLAATMVISTLIEARTVSSRWVEGAHSSPISPRVIFWRAHSITYPTLLLICWTIRFRAQGGPG